MAAKAFSAKVLLRKKKTTPGTVVYEAIDAAGQAILTTQYIQNTAFNGVEAPDEIEVSIVAK